MKSSKTSYLSLVIAAICFGSISVFAYYLGLLSVSSTQQTFLRVLFTALYLFIGIGFVYRFQNILIRRDHWKFFVAYGLLGACAPPLSYISAIVIGTPVVVAVSLAYMYPVITLLLGYVFLKESITRLRLVAFPLSVIAALLVSLPLSIEITPVPLLGIILALATALFLACNMIFGRKMVGHLGYEPIIATFWSYTFGTLWMGLLVILSQFMITDPRIVGFQLLLPPISWILLLAFALLGTALPYTLTNLGMKKIDASAASIILLLDPISSVIMGFIFLGQLIAFWQIIGASLIILASALIAIEPKLVQLQTSPAPP